MFKLPRSVLMMSKPEPGANSPPKVLANARLSRLVGRGSASCARRAVGGRSTRSIDPRMRRAWGRAPPAGGRPPQPRGEWGFTCCAPPRVGYFSRHDLYSSPPPAPAGPAPVRGEAMPRFAATDRRAAYDLVCFDSGGDERT